MSSKPCPICNSPSQLFYRDTRDFHKCTLCDFIHASMVYDVGEQEIHYKNQWENQNERFWEDHTSILLELAERLRRPTRILDFGSGSGGLTRQLQKRGFDVTPYDPMNDGPLAEQHYDAPFDTVMGLEVIEHIEDPHTTLAELETLLTPDAQIFFTTLLATKIIEQSDAVEQFAAWWYKDDPTHVSFYSSRSVATFAHLRQWQSAVFGNKAFALYRRPIK